MKLSKLSSLSTFAIALTLSSIICSASPLTPEAALSRAMGDKGHRNMPSRTAGDYRLVYTEPRPDSDEAAVYVFATGEKGYMILSADDVAYPVLGYSDRQFDESAMSLGWLKEYARQIEAADSDTPAADNYPFVDYERIEPMIETHWGNGTIYRDHTPLIDGKNSHPGDLAVAMAQIMNYHKYPAVGQGQNTYSSKGETLSYDFSTLKLDWDAMLPTYDEDCTDEQKSAIAELIAACGQAANTQYESDNSTMTLEDGALGLVNFFGYDKGISVNVASYYNIGTWIDKIYNRLAANEPLIYLFISNYTNYSGTPIYACYICDGYDSEGFFHFNANKGGSEDGYYRLTAILKNQYNSYNPYPYSTHCFISNLRPQRDDTQAEVNLGIRYGFYMSIGDLKPGKLGGLIEIGSLTNHSIETVTGMPMIGFKPKDGMPTYAYTYSKQSVSLKPGETLKSFLIQIPDLAEGQYDMSLKFETEDGSIHPIKNSEYLTMTATVSGQTVSVVKNYDMSIISRLSLREHIYWNEEFFADVRFENRSSAPVEKQLHLCAYNSTSYRLAAWCDPITVKLDAYEQTDYTPIYPKFTHFIESECKGDFYYIEFTDIESMDFLPIGLYTHQILPGKCPDPIEIKSFSFIGDKNNADPTNLNIQLSLKNISSIRDLKSEYYIGYSDGKSAQFIDSSCFGDDSVLMPLQEYSSTINMSIDEAEAGKTYNILLAKQHDGKITVIRSIPVTMATSGIEDVTVDGGEGEYYNMQGVRVDKPSHGYYIKRTSTKATKVYVQ